MAARHTTPHGLHEVEAVTSAISSISEGHLAYRGIGIDELAEHGTFEEVVFLLWHSRLPTRVELSGFKEQLAAAATLPAGLVEQMRAFPRRSTPMEVLRTAVSALAMYDPEAEDMSPPANAHKAVRLLAQVAGIVAAYDRVRNDRSPVAARPDLSLAANFLYTLRGIMPDPLAVRALDKAYILHADHELNASTFAARVTASTQSDMYSCLVAAIGTLKGAIHGGANEQVMRMLNEIGRAEMVEPYIRQKLALNERIYGFGHAVYKGVDPRAVHLRALAQELATQTRQEQWYDMSVKIEEIVTAAGGGHPNIEFYSAAVYHYLNIATDLFTPIFAISRTAGWLAHILEQYEHNVLIRPRANYAGPVHQHWVMMEKR